MASSSSSISLGLSFCLLLISPALSLTCTSQKFTSNNLYSHCLDLPTLSSFLHYTYDSSNRSLSVAFVATPSNSNGWVAWAINPTGTGMAGAQSLVAYKDSNGAMTVKTYNISSYSSVVQSKLSFEVWDTSADESGGFMRIYGKIKVPEDLAKAGKINQIWQVGPSVANGMLTKHEFSAPNLGAKGTLDLSGAQTGVTPSTGADSLIRKRNIHGILNAVSWGILFPVGVIIARYMRPFGSMDPTWFYLHISCQLCAYIIGVAGWGTGLKLGSESKGITYTTHRNLGIALFCLCTIQIFALFLRPKKDHKYRFYWNIYHHGIGFSILVLGILNVFKGLAILKPETKWKSAYIIVISVLACIALVLEAITWVVVLKRKSNRSTKP
ncbi:hypothetical protein JRO89_XS01G0059400 [Xanthoceras sorbifolium]|uniref:Cytochrome b561 and DOMON domain-containing protein n=1 Tax=Xanthoceras sorbifolium TaxID=99658 RepID=A0ABQ8IID5_9ROSI|nr:hypothetical protein JRO89_XS01G0059400 [Xanthoceras sorbifolium]